MIWILPECVASAAFIEPLPEILFVAQLLGNDVLCRTSSDSDYVKPLRILPNRSLSCKIVVKRSALSLEGFLHKYFLSSSPVTTTNCMALDQRGLSGMILIT